MNLGRNVVLWLVIALLLVAIFNLFQSSSGPSRHSSIAFSQFLEQVDEGKISEVTITGKKVTPAPATIDLKVGETLTLVVTSDHDDEIHAHGFEVEGELKAGTPSTVTITGTDPGLFEVETHEPPLRLMMIAVR